MFGARDQIDSILAVEIEEFVDLRGAVVGIQIAATIGGAALDAAIEIDAYMPSAKKQNGSFF